MQILLESFFFKKHLEISPSFVFLFTTTPSLMADPTVLEWLLHGGLKEVKRVPFCPGWHLLKRKISFLLFRELPMTEILKPKIYIYFTTMHYDLNPTEMSTQLLAVWNFFFIKVEQILQNIIEIPTYISLKLELGIWWFITQINSTTLSEFL